MKIIIILLLLIKVAYFFELNLTRLINKGLLSNGVLFDAEQYPFVVSVVSTVRLNYSYEQLICSGSLVQKLYVLTTASCIYKSNILDVQVFLGSLSNNNYRRVTQLYVPELYRDLSEKKLPYIFDDIGVIKLEKSFPNVKYVQIGGSPIEFVNLTAVECTLIGFGLKENEEYGFEGRMVTTHVRYGPTACEGHTTQVIQSHWDEYLCSTPGLKTSICKGDTGGPMICNGKLYGVASFSYNYKGGYPTCGGPNMQTVHTFINFHLDWVNYLVDDSDDPSEEKKKKKKKNSGNSLEHHLTLYTILTILFYCVLTII